MIAENRSFYTNNLVIVGTSLQWLMIPAGMKMGDAHAHRP